MVHIRSLLPVVLALAPTALAQAASSSAASGSAIGTGSSASVTATASASGSSGSSASGSASATASSTSSVAAAVATVSTSADGVSRSSKRGIVYVSPEVASDNNYWTDDNNDLTWYYNYATTPTTAFNKATHLQFVPMQWGLPANPDVDMSFYNAVKNLKKSMNITAVLGFNEPDGCSNGGSCLDPKQAAVAWVKQFEPMRQDLGVRLGGPGCTGASTGWKWLQAFHTACAALKNNNTGCVMDFLPIHWYGNFDGLASHLGSVNSTYSNVSSIWVTEFAYNDQDLTTSQSFYNSSISYLDKLSNIERYSYFGPFRSDVSNVGPNAAFLTQNGNLTDIGSWYLGGSATGNIPSSTRGTRGNSSATFTPGTYSGAPYSAGNRSGVFAGWLVFVAAAISWVFV